MKHQKTQLCRVAFAIRGNLNIDNWKEFVYDHPNLSLFVQNFGEIRHGKWRHDEKAILIHFEKIDWSDENEIARFIDSFRLDLPFEDYLFIFVHSIENIWDTKGSWTDNCFGLKAKFQIWLKEEIA